MANDIRALTNPQEIASAGERIYKEKYRAAYEEEHAGQFAAIDVTTGHAYLAKFPEEAIETAKKSSPNGLFHLIKIGAPGAFRVSRASNANSNWIFR